MKPSVMCDVELRTELSPSKMFALFERGKRVLITLGIVFFKSNH